MIKRKKSKGVATPVAMLFLIYIAVVILTYIIPSGEYTRVFNEVTQSTTIVGDSFRYVSKSYLNIMDIFRGIHEGFVDASDIIYMCFFVGFYIRVINTSGAFDAAIGNLLKRFGVKNRYALPVITIIISLFGYSIGEAEGIYPLIPLFVATAIKMGYDDVVGLAISGGAIMIGFSSSAFNPYTIGVAQKIAELPLYSGALYRTLIYIVFVSLYIWWMMRYASKIASQNAGLTKATMSQKYATNLEKMDIQPFTIRHKVILGGFLAIIILIVYGAVTFGWYFTEISALFIAGGIFTCIYQRYSAQEISKLLVDGISDILIGVVIIGLARSILVIMSKAVILDTIVYGSFKAISVLPRFLLPIGMLLFQTLLNFTIPSGSGQAAAIMPIMVPLADLLDVNRQVAVLAFQMGDGFSNLLWPTASITAMCSIGKVSLNKWYKFFIPIFLVMAVIMCAFLIIADLSNYGPF